MIPTYTVDVVIPCFNGAIFIERCVKSVLSQTAPVNRIIFVDDGSTDKSLETILSLQEKYPIIKVITQDNRGLAAARNKGLSYSES
ncbi:MAG: glycosyltransferase family 2 protein, partial [Candidatus Planktophila sp.]